MRRRDLLILGGSAALVLGITLGPLVVGLAGLLRNPPPDHLELFVFGFVYDALDRLLWSVCGAAVVLAVLVVVGAVRAPWSQQRRAEMRHFRAALPSE